MVDDLQEEVEEGSHSLEREHVKEAETRLMVRDEIGLSFVPPRFMPVPSEEKDEERRHSKEEVCRRGGSGP